MSLTTWLFAGYCGIFSVIVALLVGLDPGLHFSQMFSVGLSTRGDTASRLVGVASLLWMAGMPFMMTLYARARHRRKLLQTELKED